MFKICPDCNNDKIKFKVMEKRTYDPATTRVVLEEEVPVVEYHCHECGWTVLVEDPPVLPQEEILQGKR
jgi:hypothetical protein